MKKYYIEFVTVYGRHVVREDLSDDHLSVARVFFRMNHPRFFRDVQFTLLKNRDTGRVVSKEAI